VIGGSWDEHDVAHCPPLPGVSFALLLLALYCEVASTQTSVFTGKHFTLGKNWTMSFSC